MTHHVNMLAPYLAASAARTAIPPRPYAGSYGVLRDRAADRQRMRDLVEGPGDECTECGSACHGENCDACAADLDPAVEDCLGCGVTTDVNDLDDHGLCSPCVREAEDAALEILP